jgi:hypothetical protein
MSMMGQELYLDLFLKAVAISLRIMSSQMRIKEQLSVLIGGSNCPSQNRKSMARSMVTMY